MIHLILPYKIIAKEEDELIYEFGIGLSDIESASVITEAIQQCYVPSLKAIMLR